MNRTGWKNYANQSSQAAPQHVSQTFMTPLHQHAARPADVVCVWSKFRKKILIYFLPSVAYDPDSNTTVLWQLYRTTCIRRHPPLWSEGFWQQSFPASIPLPTATNTFGLERICYCSLWQGYLHRLHTFTIRTSYINLISITVKISCLYVSY